MVPRRRPAARWVLPLAMAAGLTAMGTALVVSRWNSVEGTSVPLAAAPDGSTRTASARPAEASVVESAVAGGKLVRDAQLDRYLRAHREYGAAAPGSLPGGAGRSIEAVSFQR
jgi:sigma-E factor negative regulatory protein RseA